MPLGRSDLIAAVGDPIMAKKIATGRLVRSVMPQLGRLMNLVNMECYYRVLLND